MLIVSGIALFFALSLSFRTFLNVLEFTIDLILVKKAGISFVPGYLASFFWAIFFVLRFWE